LRIKAIFFDLGDTIMVEASEVKDEVGTTLAADLIPGVEPALRELKARGFPLGLVADTRRGTYQNVLRQHGLYDLFDVFAISDELGVEKPAPGIFSAALDALGVRPGDYDKVLMVGNNLRRDIRGANALGLVSVWFHWNDRYPTQPADEMEEPAFVVHSAEELLERIDLLEQGLSEGRNQCHL
jgi:HAD superfamily hydrolase (TIGR01549 family)